MATRYVVRWVESSSEGKQEEKKRGFAFQGGALGLWRNLVDLELYGKRFPERYPLLTYSKAVIEYMGPNGERHQDVYN